MYANVGRPAIAQESIRSRGCPWTRWTNNLCLAGFVGLNADDDVWDAATFAKNRCRLLETDVAGASAVVES